MRLGPEDFAALCAEVARELKGARVQKAFSVARAACVLQLKGADDPVHLLVRAGAAWGRLSVLEAKPPPRKDPPQFQALLRRHLEGAALESAWHSGSRLHLSFTRGPEAVTLIAELAGPGALAVTEAGKVRALDTPRGAAPQDLLPGRLWEAPPIPPRPPVGRSGAVPLLRSAEARVGLAEHQAAAREAARPIARKLARLERTLEKVRADGAREGDAEAHRKDGELLKHNLHRVTRGLKEVELEDYAADGTVALHTVKLDPKKTGPEQVAWHFHQARRISRGIAMAQERLNTLLAERLKLEQQRDQPAATSGYVEAAEALVDDEAPSPARPFREYAASGGVRIRVGKGPAHNDTLTFHLALPHHVWLHARGAGGAHVVVPLEKGAELPQEVLLDAAHLALHHSTLKGEPRGEVSWTYARFLKKPKGAAPGLVTYSRDRTFWVRVEPERLARLLAAEV